MTLQESDEELASILVLARKVRVTVHVRGTDSHPIVELRDRYTKYTIGGTELRKRFERTRKREESK